ncbi:uncharacterized protein LOC110220982 isoform X1 [Phascolarctos cinereus]
MLPSGVVSKNLRDSKTKGKPLIPAPVHDAFLNALLLCSTAFSSMVSRLLLVDDRCNFDIMAWWWTMDVECSIPCHSWPTGMWEILINVNMNIWALLAQRGNSGRTESEPQAEEHRPEKGSIGFTRLLAGSMTQKSDTGALAVL